MAEQRMSLEDAGRVLGGLHPNTIRSRARNGKYRYETDNSGKWWVFIDPDKAANDPARKPPKPPTMEAPLEPIILSGFKTLEVTIQALNQELEATREERDGLRVRAAVADRLEAETAGLRAQLDYTRETVADLRARLDLEAGERRAVQERLEAIREMPAAPAPAARGRGWWSKLWGRAAND